MFRHVLYVIPSLVSLVNRLLPRSCICLPLFPELLGSFLFASSFVCQIWNLSWEYWMNVVWLLLYVGFSPSFISQINSCDNWNQLSGSLPWGGDFREYSQATAKTPFVLVKVPCLLWSNMDYFHFLLVEKSKRPSAHPLELRIYRTRNSLPCGL